MLFKFDLVFVFCFFPVDELMFLFLTNKNISAFDQITFEDWWSGKVHQVFDFYCFSCHTGL